MVDITTQSEPGPADVVARPFHKGDRPSLYARRRGFVARAGQVVAEPAADGEGVLLNVGLGAAEVASPATFRSAAANAVRAAGPVRRLRLDLVRTDQTGVSEAERARAVAEGAVLAAYRYREFKSSPAPSTLREVVVVTEERTVVADAVMVCDGTRLARDLVNRPPGALTPAGLADQVCELAEGHELKCSVHEGTDLERLGMAGLIGVGRGSRRPPRYVVLTYEPGIDRPMTTLALVGKGITFDSGGLSLKSTRSMCAMKSDMGGAAAVIGAFLAVSRLGLPIRLRGYLPLAENMPGDDALRVGDVIRHGNGTTTEVLNTDHEGRLVLADALVRASSADEQTRPDVVVDVATLTSGVAHVLGTRAAALFAADEWLADAVLKAADRAGEPIWRLPLWDFERRRLRSETADRTNAANAPGDAVHAALFLREFVAKDVPWAHLDIATVAYNEESPYDEVPHGGTGFGARTVVELARLLTT